MRKPKPYIEQARDIVAECIDRDGKILLMDFGSKIKYTQRELDIKDRVELDYQRMKREENEKNPKPVDPFVTPSTDTPKSIPFNYSSDWMGSPSSNSYSAYQSNYGKPQEPETLHFHKRTECYNHSTCSNYHEHFAQGPGFTEKFYIELLKLANWTHRLSGWCCPDCNKNRDMDMWGRH